MLTSLMESTCMYQFQVYDRFFLYFYLFIYFYLLKRNLKKNKKRYRVPRVELAYIGRIK